MTAIRGLALVALLAPPAHAAVVGPIFPTTGIAVPVAAPAPAAWGRAFDAFSSWMTTPAGRDIVIPLDSSLVSISKIHPEARRIAIGPMVARLSPELASSVERIAELSKDEQLAVFKAVSKARAEATPTGEALALAAWERAKPAVLEAEVGELRSLADQLKGMALYGPEVRLAYRHAKRKLTERLMRSAGDTSKRLLRGIDWDSEDFGGALPAETQRSAGAAYRLAPSKALPSSSYYDAMHWRAATVPDRRYARRLDAAAELFSARDAASSFRELRRRESRDRLLATIREKDPAIHSHLMRVGLMAGLIAWRMGMTMEYAERAAWGARIHDIGKREDAILEVVNKQGKLTPEERLIMERHTTAGAEIVEADLGLDILSRRVGARVARSHHETLDGTGYPRKLKDDEIALDARIVSVADFFDALMENRPYRKGLTLEQALAIMEPHAPKFDPAVWQAFKSLVQPPAPVAAAAAN